MQTYQESVDLNEENNDSLMSLLNIFSFTAMIIAGLGVFSNISISYMYRQKEGAVFSSLGLTKGQAFSKALIESVLIIIVSFVIAILVAIPTFSIVSLLGGLDQPSCGDVSLNDRLFSKISASDISKLRRRVEISIKKQGGTLSHLVYFYLLNEACSSATS